MSTKGKKKKKKKKKKKWKVEEIDVLMQEVEKQKPILLGKQSAIISNDRKKIQLQVVTTAANMVRKNLLSFLVQLYPLRKHENKLGISLKLSL